MTESKSMAIIPASIGEARSLANTFSQSTLLPPALQGKESDVFVTIIAGMELGLPPMAALRSVHVVKGKPVLSADAMVAVAHASGCCEYFVCISSNEHSAKYETKRKGSPKPQSLEFTIREAESAGLLGNDNWRKYPSAMLRARAKAALARDVYPDCLAACYTHDESLDFDNGTSTDTAIEVLPEADRSTSLGEEEQRIVDEIMNCNTLQEIDLLAEDLKTKGLDDVTKKAVFPFYKQHRGNLEARENVG